MGCEGQAMGGGQGGGRGRPPSKGRHDPSCRAGSRDQGNECSSASGDAWCARCAGRGRACAWPQLRATATAGVPAGRAARYRPSLFALGCLRLRTAPEKCERRRGFDWSQRGVCHAGVQCRHARRGVRVQQAGRRGGGGSSGAAPQYTLVELGYHLPWVARRGPSWCSVRATQRRWYPSSTRLSLPRSAGISVRRGRNMQEAGSTPPWCRRSAGRVEASQSPSVPRKLVLIPTTGGYTVRHPNNTQHHPAQPHPAGAACCPGSS